MKFSLPLVLSVFVLLATLAPADAKTGDQICKKMISEGRGGGMSQNTCICTHRVADEVLDDTIKSLLFDAWYTGNNNMQALADLPKQSRVRRQMKKLARSLKAQCE
ncbi:MAG: hypothetical protein AAGD04_05300 [Pseudomonadota bacterium]